MSAGHIGRPLLVLLLSLSLPAIAAPSEVPPQLERWIPWVLEGHEQERCPSGPGLSNRCAWPTSLELDVKADGGTFRITWQRYDAGRVELPGNARHFPQEVRVNDRPHPVLLRQGVPSVEVSPGRHVISGRFSWSSAPNSIRVPQQTGLLSVSVRGTPLENPRVENNTLFFVEQSEPGGEAPRQDTLAIRVHRVVTDAVPLRVETTLKLEVSGKGREVLLGRPLLAGGRPLSISGELPARLEPDGRLRTQVRAGSWTLQIVELHMGPATELSRVAPQGPWDPDDEIWAFAAAPELRLVTVLGVPSVDPAQTSLPNHLWNLPMYSVGVDTPMRLQVERRGDASSPADQIALRRQLWLDFDGGGFTAADTFDATLHRSSRLSAAGGTTLGRVSVNNEPQFITRLPGADTAGVEVRHGVVRVSADSRVDRVGSVIPAVGWAHDVQSLEATLHLPAGWSLLHAGGVDRARTWVSSWTLLDVFLLVIIAFATGRLYGWRGGLLAFLAVTLSFHESGAPVLLWLTLLCFEALRRVNSKGRFATALNLGRWVTVGVLVVTLVSYSVSQVRQGLFPVLGPEDGVSSVGFIGEVAQAPAAGSALAEQEASADQNQNYATKSVTPYPSTTDVLGFSERGAPPPGPVVKKKAPAYDRDTVVQTGPGLPNWSWNSVHLGFSGPVQQAQELRLWLLPPWVNQGLSFLRVLLFVLLGLLMTGLLRRPSAGARGSRVTPPPAAAGLLLLVGLLATGPARAQEGGEAYPSAGLLQELRTRLLRPAECEPDCTTLNRMNLELSERQLRARLQVSAEATTAFALPGSRNGWQPETVRIDGRPAGALQRNGSGVLHVVLEPGLHELILEGPLPSRSSLSLHLPSQPMFTEVSAQGWTVEGLQEDGRVSGDLEFSRVRREELPLEQQPLQESELPPYLLVERVLSFGTEWTVETVVQRVSPPGRAVVLGIPLLTGESVITPDVEVRDGQVQLNLSPGTLATRWSSRLQETERLELTAPGGAPWSEVWRLSSGPLWHVTVEGLPPVLQTPEPSERIPTYRPWAGEQLTLTFTRPLGIGGRTVTIDQSHLVVRPGRRNTEATLTATFRSSRGGPHELTLPEGATLTGVTLDGRSLPLRQEGRKVTLPLSPGVQKLALNWNQAEGISARFGTPTIDLGQPSVNASVHLEVPKDRWILFTAGPRLGPAILFWPTFLVLVIVALALSRLRWVPLRAWEWLLLTIGLSQVPVAVAAIIPAWLIVLGLRRRSPDLEPNLFNLRQIGVVALTLLALGVLVIAIHTGLLSTPEMRIEGNGSWGYGLKWYQDRIAGDLPMATVISAPILVFRLVMLAWALWLAASLLRWLRFGYAAFTEGGLWKQPILKARPAAGPPPTAPGEAPEPGPGT